MLLIKESVLSLKEKNNNSTFKFLASTKTIL